MHLFPFFHFPLVFLLIPLLLYFLPALLARNKSDFASIFLLNLFLGWTFIGWVIALVWALSAEPQPRPAAAPQSAAGPSQPARPGGPASAPGFFCSSCGKPFAPGARFCSSCGAPT